MFSQHHPIQRDKSEKRKRKRNKSRFTRHRARDDGVQSYRSVFVFVFVLYFHELTPACSSRAMTVSSHNGLFLFLFLYFHELTPAVVGMLQTDFGHNCVRGRRVSPRGGRFGENTHQVHLIDTYVPGAWYRPGRHSFHAEGASLAFVSVVGASL